MKKTMVVQAPPQTPVYINRWGEVSTYEREYYFWYYNEYIPWYYETHPEVDKPYWMKTKKELEIDSILMHLPLSKNTNLVVIKFTRDPDVKAVVKILEGDELSEKSWKRTVHHKCKPNRMTGETEEYDYILMNGQEIRLRNVSRYI